MIEIKCKSEHSLKLTEMTPFQGELKKRKDKDLDELSESLGVEGLLTPYFIWQADNGTNYILDGHGRRAASIKRALEDPSILEQEFPVIYVEASTETEAREALLQIVSTYGKIDTKSVMSFAEGTNTRAPILRKAFKKEVKPKVMIPTATVIIKVQVAKDKADELKTILKSVAGVEVL